MTDPPICDYEGSDYQTSFWEQGGREYEDRAEAIALRHLLPPSGHLLLELGAGAGRNTPRYAGYERIVLLDYSRTQLEQARARLGDSPRFIYVAADIYRLPFVAGLFDGATMIRTLHHMQDAPRALAQVRRALQPGGIFVLEYANKRNLKAILRYLLGGQTWSPFTPEPVEFAALNFDFHPETVRRWLADLGFRVEQIRTVSRFRAGPLKRLVPARWLAALDELFQPTGALIQLRPSVFVRASVVGRDAIPRFAEISPPAANELSWFQCPECGHHQLEDKGNHLACPNCGRKWAVRDGIYDFKEPVE